MSSFRRVRLGGDIRSLKFMLVVWSAAEKAGGEGSAAVCSVHGLSNANLSPSLFSQT